MTKAKAILVVAFLLAFAAGGALGVFLNRSTESKAGHQEHWAKELNLTSEQEAQIDKIWSDAMAPLSKYSQRREKRDQDIQKLLSDQQKSQYQAIGRDYNKATDEAMQSLRDKREQAITAMLTKEQQDQYQTIQADYAKASEEYAQVRRKAVEQAQAQTRAKLTPEQAQKYDEMLKKQHERSTSGRFHRGSRATAPASAPASGNQTTTAPHGEE